MRRFEGAAVLFDLDGVLIDSTPAVERAWREWSGRRGLDADRILSIAHGRRTVETIELAAPHLDAESEALALEGMEAGNAEGVLEVEGARALLSYLPTAIWAVVTSGTRSLAAGRMERFDLPLPRTFVTAESVVNGKPAPEAYLMGAKLLGVSVGDCVVVEDAPSGIKAARSAGMTVVAVATTHEPGDLSEADAVFGSLSEIEFAVEVIPEPGSSRGVYRVELGGAAS